MLPLDLGSLLLDVSAEQQLEALGEAILAVGGGRLGRRGLFRHLPSLLALLRENLHVDLPFWTRSVEECPGSVTRCHENPRR